jgi:hypothetical protein
LELTGLPLIPHQILSQLSLSKERRDERTASHAAALSWEASFFLDLLGTFVSRQKYHAPAAKSGLELPNRSFLMLFISIYWFWRSCFRKLKIAYFFIKEYCAAILNTPKIDTREKMVAPAAKSGKSAL